MLGFGGLFVYAVLADNAPDSFLTSGITGVCWGLLLFVFVALFQQLPELPNPDHSSWQRVSLRVRRAGYGLLGLITIGLTVAVVMATFRVL